MGRRGGGGVRCPEGAGSAHERVMCVCVWGRPAKFNAPRDRNGHREVNSMAVRAATSPPVTQFLIPQPQAEIRGEVAYVAIILVPGRQTSRLSRTTACRTPPPALSLYI